MSEIQNFLDSKKLEKLDYNLDNLNKDKKLELKEKLEKELKNIKDILGEGNKNSVNYEKLNKYFGGNLKKEYGNNTRKYLEERQKITEQINKEIEELQYLKTQLKELINDIKNNKEFEINNISVGYLKYSFDFNKNQFKDEKINFNKVENQKIILPDNLKNFQVSGYIQIGNDKFTIIDQKIYELKEENGNFKLKKSNKYKLEQGINSILIKKIEENNENISDSEYLKKKARKIFEENPNLLSNELFQKLGKSIENNNNLRRILNGLNENTGIDTNTYTNIIYGYINGKNRKNFLENPETLSDFLSIFDNNEKYNIDNLISDLIIDYEDTKFLIKMIENKPEIFRNKDGYETIIGIIDLEQKINPTIKKFINENIDYFINNKDNIKESVKKILEKEDILD